MATKRKSSDVLEILRGDLGLLSNSNLTNGGSNKIVNDNFEGVKVDGGGWWKVCKCEVEKQDKAVQVSDTDLKDEELGRMETTNGQLHGVDNTRGIIHDVSTTVEFYLYYTFVKLLRLIFRLPQKPPRHQSCGRTGTNSP